MNKTVQILQIPGKMDSGGVSSVIMNYYRHIDKTKVQFDFAVNKDCTFPQEKELQEGGSRIYRVSSLKNIIGYCADIYHIVRRNKYKIVHAHMNTLNVFPLMAAWMGGAKVRISHIHSVGSSDKRLRSLAKKILKIFSKIFPTHFASCSVYAAEWMLGEKYIQKHPVQIIKNGIEIDRFIYRPEVRDSVRRQLKIQNQFVIGCVGRFVFQKNHEFLLRVFEQVAKSRDDVVLVLIGEGRLQHNIERLAEDKGMSGKIKFLGVKENVSDYYQAMDLFILTSRYEGFPVVTVEAQVAGLPCIVSTAVPEEAIFTGQVKRMPLNLGVSEWKECIVNMIERPDKRGEVQIDYGEIDINNAARTIEDYYLHLNIGIAERG